MVAFIIGFTIASCCSNAFSFEILVKQNSQISTLITLLQYISIFLTLSGYLKLTKFWKDEGNFKSYNPWSIKYLIPIIIHNFCASMSNYAFNYNISMSTFIIIKSLGPPVTLIFGLIFWGKSYGLNKIIGSILIAIGSGLFTINVQDFKGEIKGESNIIGILILFGIILVSSMTSLYTAEIYQSKSSGVDWKVIMYYNYLVGLILNLPLVSIVFSGLEEKMNYWNILWNLITQILCVIGVNILTFKLTALTLSIVLIIRRFVSLFISIYQFEIPVNKKGFIGVVLVLLGSFIYALPNKEFLQNESLIKI